MSAGDGYRYLLRTVAAGDGARSLSTPLTRYYAEKGTPPGTWAGSAVGEVGDGVLVAGDLVTEQQLQLLLGLGHDPVKGEPLGRAYPVYASLSERVQRRIDSLDPNLTGDARAAAIAGLEAEERAAGSRRAVAGYDLTFSVPKSVSTLWALSDAPTQAKIVALHHQAVHEVIGFMEREIAGTRTGVLAGGGAVAQVPTTGVIAAAYDHYDSRAGDPHLHTHVVISNKVRTALDGRWRSLDGRPVLAAAVALSELHEGLVADLITREFGLQWGQRERGADRNPAWDLTVVPVTLLREFSSRSASIDREKDRLIEAYRVAHGWSPSAATVLRLRAQATLSTRAPKQVRSLADLAEEWRRRGTRVLGTDARQWARAQTRDPTVPAAARAEQFSAVAIDDLAASVVAVVGEKRSTWRRWNLHAEASRQLKGVRFTGMSDREAATELVVDAALRASLQLSPADNLTVPVEFQRADGSSVFRPRYSTLYSSAELLAVEQRLLERANHRIIAPIRDATLARMSQPRRGRRLSADQVDAIFSIARSRRAVDLLVGPAGTGKTTTMTGLRAVWEADHGRGSVVGLAPSAVAADVLGRELGIRTENTAKWLHDHRAGATAFTAGQLVVIDEASLAGTRALDAITAHAEMVGAKVLLVGDWAQLQAVDAGGAFSLLVHDRDDVAELADVHRFAHAWEKTASILLRHGRPAAIEAYLTRGRVLGGETDHVTDLAYRAWRDDRAAGRTSILVAPTREVVTVLNERARAERIVALEITPANELLLAGEVAASVGDEVITRRNGRTLAAGRTGRIHNGDRWTITKVHANGGATLRRAGYRRGASVRLPQSYVSQHVDLGYAVTGYGAQGVTVDSAHAIVLPGTTREHLYVALTRGRQSNIAYVATDRPDLDHSLRHPGDDPTISAMSVLHGVLRHVGAERSATASTVAERERWGSIAQLAAEYETIAAVAQHQRWTALIRTTSLSQLQADAVIESDAFGALAAALRRAEAYGFNVDAVLPRLVAARDLSTASDPAAVLHQRLATATTPAVGSSHARREPRLIAGLLPEATGPMPEPMRIALKERQEAIEHRATEVLQRAAQRRDPWVAQLGTPPADIRARATWVRHARATAAYRDRYEIEDTEPLGRAATNTAQERAREVLLTAYPHNQDRSTPTENPSLEDRFTGPSRGL